MFWDLHVVWEADMTVSAPVSFGRGVIALVANLTRGHAD